MEESLTLPETRVVGVGHLIRLVPRANPQSLVREIRQLTRDLGLECEVTPYQWSRGHIAQNAEVLIEAVRQERNIRGKDFE